MAADAELHFDGWTVNRVSGEVARTDHVPATARLPPQLLRILLELADHAGAIVTRERLVKVLWPEGIVDFDNGLNVAVRKLRVALDDVGDAPRYIETLPKVGYRFLAKPGAAAVKLPSKRASARVLLALAVVALGAAVAVAWWWPMRAHHVPSVRAQELYLEAMHQRARRDVNGYKLAIENFQAAVKEDPNYPQAWAGLGEGYSGAVMRQMIPPGEGVPKARAAARRALALDDDIVEVHALLGQIHLDHERHFAAADQEFRRALELNDHSSRLWHHIAMWHAHQGHVAEAFAAVRRARELEPMTLLYSGSYGLLLYNSRRYDEAIEFLRPLADANPGFNYAHSILARALMATGDLTGAQEQLSLVTEPGVNQSDLGSLYAKLGHREDALREIARLEARGREGYGVAYDEAVIYVALGELDRGCETLARAVDDHSLILAWMRLDPRVDSLRDRQCFADVEKRVYAQ